MILNDWVFTLLAFGVSFMGFAFYKNVRAPGPVLYWYASVPITERSRKWLGIAFMAAGPIVLVITIIKYILHI